MVRRRDLRQGGRRFGATRIGPWTSTGRSSTSTCQRGGTQPAAHELLQRALAVAEALPAEVVTDRAPVYPRLVDELIPTGWHHSEQYANNRIEADHGQLERRLRTMRHLRNDRTAAVIITGHALVQNLRRGHYHIIAGLPITIRLAAAFDGLSHAI